MAALVKLSIRLCVSMLVALAVVSPATIVVGVFL